MSLPFYENKPDLTHVDVVQNMSFPLHLHRQMELLYLTGGEMRVTVDGCCERLKQGELAAVFPNRVHSYETVGNSRGILLITPPSALGRAAGENKGKRPVTPFLHAERLPFELAHNFEELGAAPADAEYLRDALAQLIFVRVLDCLELAAACDYDGSELIGRAVTYISEQYRGDIHLQKVAQQLGVSKCYLSRLLSAALGMGFCGYINCLRVNYAKNLLKNSPLSVLEIALDSGYENLRTFNRAFKAATGCTPREYQKQ